MTPPKERTPRASEEAVEGEATVASDSPRRLDPAQLKATRGFVGKAMLIVFGVGAGIAVSVAVADTPDDFRTVAVEGGGGGTGQVVTETSIDESGNVQTVTRQVGGGPTAVVGPEGVAAAGPEDDAQTVGPVPVENPKDYECTAEKNGGETDAGVSSGKISVAANVVLDGAGASFLREAIIGIQAVIDEANVNGICGRRIELKTRNDSWDAPTGLSYIENYIDEGRFALVVNPSSEGLDAAVKNGVIDRAEIPVVGTDGMLKSQYEWDEGGDDLASWLWPVAASTRTTMHIIVQNACDRGAASFALVYDKHYKFGVEGKDAFVGQFNRLKKCGGKTPTLVDPLGIEPAQQNYLGPADTFNQRCTSGGQASCDLVALLLDSGTAVTWIQSGATFGKAFTMGPQPLFNDSFAERCVSERDARGGDCDLIVWTGYEPPIGTRANLPDVAKYVNDLRARDASADPNNAFTEGAYLGAKVFVEALKKVGPNLTRENLRSVLNGLTYSSDLSKPLAWSETSHYANTQMQAFKITSTEQQGFTGWADDTTWQPDPEVGKD